MNTTDMDISISAGNIVTNALQVTRNLFCPFCGEAYMFEFTLKEHLKKSHHNQLKKQISQPTSDTTLNHSFLSNNHNNLHNCPFCGAVFILFGLIPKHILTYHGVEIYDFWKRQDDNILKWEAAKENEPIIKFETSSSGMTDFFDQFTATTVTNASLSAAVVAAECLNEIHLDQPMNIDDNEPAPKSILKKTPNKCNRIICSPSSAAIRRSKSDVVKRSISCRRELRFDPSTKKSPPHLAHVTKISPKPKKNGKLLQFISMFNRRKKTTSSSTSGNSNIVTSTPINFLDNDNDNNDPIFNCRKNWKSSLMRKNRNRPLFFDNERYQCAFCKQTWECNDDLLKHLSEHHRGVKQYLRPQYRCSLCGATFFHNSYLLKHCHMQHTT